MTPRFNCLAAIFALLATLTAGVVAQQTPSTGAAALRSAKDLELVKGDLEGALKAYQSIVTTYAKTDRAIASEALLRMAECYRRLGDAQATKVYERVIKEFGDQNSQVGAARARLAANDSAPRNRLVWSVPREPFFWGNVSPDGRWLAHANGFSGDVFVRDLAAGVDRRVTNTAKPASPAGNDREGYGDDASVFSRDGKQLAYSWVVGRREELRLINLEAPGMPVPRTLLKEDDIQWANPIGWSPDGKLIAIGIWRFKQNHADLGVLSVETGAFRQIARVNEASGDAIRGAGFSPDGRYILYNPDRDGGNESRDIVVVNIATKEETRLPLPPNNDKAIGWAPDGGIVFTSDRTGTSALWHAEFKSGVIGSIKPLGTSPFGYNRETWWDLGLTTSGALYYRIFPQSLSDVQIFPADLAKGEIGSQKTNAAATYIGASSGPAISPDGTQLAFLSRRSTSEQTVVVRSLGTGAARDFRTGLSTIGLMTWAPDGNALYFSARTENVTGLYRVDLRTGAVNVLRKTGNLRQVSADSSRVYYDDATAGDATARSVIELDLASGQTREIHRGPNGGANRLVLSPDGRTVYYRNPVPIQPGPHELVAKNVTTGQESKLVSGRQLFALHVSPDGRFIVTMSPNPSTKQPGLLLIPTDGSGPRDVGTGLDVLAWSPDSRSIIAYRAGGPANRTASVYWQVPIDGSAPRPLNLPMNGRYLERIVAAGKWVVIGETDPNDGPNAAAVSQLWVLENFLPKPPGGRGAGGR